LVRIITLRLALTPGSRLGPYEITAKLGEGGMGEVYRATDTHLKRAVAIKVLPASVAGDHERLARFQREAELLAALNHPNSAAIYGLEKTPHMTALVMELVEGEDLSAHIARGPIPIAEALPIARQIAEALEAAHDQGIIHRDLKPANIKVRADGTVKVLDFGLAKAMETPGAMSVSASQAPTITTPVMMTGVGMILGTAAYMSPEQAKGRAVDARADVWAFGVVLFEMLSRQRAFDGEDVADVLGAVTRLEPRWDVLPVSVPPRVMQVLRGCLQKNVKARLAHIQDVRLALDGAFETAALPVAAPAAAPPPFWRRAIPVALGAVLASALTFAAAWSLRPSPPPLAVTRSVFPLPEGQTFTNVGRNTVAISPDGTRMVYVANSRLYLRSLSEVDARPIAGTEGFPNVINPVFSPDGQSVAFYTTGDNTIKRIAVTGGAAVTIAPATIPFGMSWGPDGVVFGQAGAGILRVSPAGGTSQVLVKVNEDETAGSPQVLPDGEHVLFTLATGTAADRWEQAQVVVQSLASGARRVSDRSSSTGR
jgi:serine/threonine-protein kinase